MEYNYGLADVISGKDSLKTENMIDFPPVTWIYLGAALFLAIVGSQIVVHAIFKK